MRRRLLCRDLAACAAFAAMAISGEVPLWATAVFGIAFAFALAGRRPLARVSSWSALGLIVALFVLVRAAATMRLEYVVASCTFAALITAHRMLSQPTLATDNQVHLTSLLMLAGGAALSSELLFALFLGLFAVFGTLSLGLAVLGADERPVPKTALRQLLAGAAFAVVGSAALFLLLPRLPQAAAHRVGRGLGGAVTGFSDQVSLGEGGGDIKTSARIVARAQLSPDPTAPQLGAYWVGRAYDRFDGRAWHSSGLNRRPRGQVTLRPGSGRLIGQRLELLPAYGSKTLIALDRPALFGNAIAQGRLGPTRSDLLEVSEAEVLFLSAGTGYGYYAYSLPPDQPAPPERLASQARYGQLPANLDPRIAALADQVAGDAADPGVAARRLEGYLKARYAYTLSLGAPADDPLAAFLFDRRAGHCEYFATALAILLRTRGIPSRLVAGFYGGDRVGDEYILRAGDAHAWTEALVDDRWIHLDATPEANRSAQTSPLVNAIGELYERLETFWRSRVLDYSLEDQVDLAQRIVQPPSLPAGLWGSRWRSAAAVGVALVLAVVLARRLWRRRGHGSEAGRLRQAIERVLEKDRLPGEPLEEAQRRLQAAHHPLSPWLARATRRYLEARFGGAALDRRERARLVRELRQAARATRDRGPWASSG